MATKSPTRSRIRAPYDVMCKVLGNPTHHPASGERVAWDVDVDGARARIADHHNDHPVGSNIFEATHAIWHVEAKDEEQLAWICSTISERVIEAVAKQTGARTLTPEDKAEVNALLRAGVPLGEAMKRVRTQLVEGGARSLYQWPMKDFVAMGATSFGPPASVAHEDESDESDGGAPEHAPMPSTPSAPSAPQPSALEQKLAKSKGPLGPPIPADMPRGTIDAPFERLRALLGEPEDRPVPFVSTRWRFVLDLARPEGRQIVRHEEEARDDPTDIDVSIFDRIGRYDEPFAARAAPTFTWTLTSTAAENIDRVLAWLDERLRR